MTQALADALWELLTPTLLADPPPTPQRWPLLRTGRRDHIPMLTRRLVHERDGYACQHCGFQLGLAERQQRRASAGDIRLELDHIHPWSAYGRDRSDNLQTLCDPCNDDRSNWRVPSYRHTIGVVRRCFWCVLAHETVPEPYSDLPVDELDRVPAYCGSCGGTSWVPDAGWLL